MIHMIQSYTTKEHTVKYIIKFNTRLNIFTVISENTSTYSSIEMFVFIIHLWQLCKYMICNKNMKKYSKKETNL